MISKGGSRPITPPAGYIWTNAAQAGISLRNYGYFADNLEKPRPDGEQISGVHDPVLAQVTNMKYRAFDLDYTDMDRAKVFIDDFDEFEKSGAMPQFRSCDWATITLGHHSRKDRAAFGGGG